jgi:hypothetical protein
MERHFEVLILGNILQAPPATEELSEHFPQPRSASARLTVGRSAASRASEASGPSESEGGESAATITCAAPQGRCQRLAPRAHLSSWPGATRQLQLKAVDTSAVATPRIPHGRRERKRPTFTRSRSPDTPCWPAPRAPAPRTLHALAIRFEWKVGAVSREEYDRTEAIFGRRCESAAPCGPHCDRVACLLHA